MVPMEKVKSLKLKKGEHIEVVFEADGRFKSLNHKSSTKGFGPILEAEVNVFVDGEPFDYGKKSMVIVTHSSPACVWYMDPVTRTWKVRCS